MQRTQIPGTRLLEKPAALREACDIIPYSSAQITRSQDLRHRGFPTSGCNCSIREKKRLLAAKKVRLGKAILSNDYHEASMHFECCPLHVKTKAQRRISAQLCAGVWSRLSVLVRASLSCTTGAGGFSISPQLSFHLVVQNHPAAQVITKLFIDDSVRYIGSQISLIDWIKLIASAESRILQMFQDGEVSPFDRLPDGSTLLHVSFNSVPV